MEKGPRNMGRRRAPQVIHPPFFAPPRLKTGGRGLRPDISTFLNPGKSKIRPFRTVETLNSLENRIFLKYLKNTLHSTK